MLWLHPCEGEASGASAAESRPIDFETSDPELKEAFDWAKKQALSYAFSDDPVGAWYEAALPGREAFCMRDVSHQSMGAHALGLSRHTKNMLRKFAENISESKDWCSYWEINRYGLRLRCGFRPARGPIRRIPRLCTHPPASREPGRGGANMAVEPKSHLPEISWVRITLGAASATVQVPE